MFVSQALTARREAPRYPFLACSATDTRRPQRTHIDLKLTSHRYALQWFAVKTTSVRLPDDLYEQVAKLAADERRSLSSQIIVLIEAGLNAIEQAGEATDA